MQNDRKKFEHKEYTQKRKSFIEFKRPAFEVFMFCYGLKSNALKNELQKKEKKRSHNRDFLWMPKERARVRRMQNNGKEKRKKNPDQQ